jgi:hypothetical protein
MRKENKTMLNRQQLIQYAQWHGAERAQALQYQQVCDVIHQQAALATGDMQTALLNLERMSLALSRRYPLCSVQEMMVRAARTVYPYAPTDEMRAMYRWVIEQLAPLPTSVQHSLPPVNAPSFKLQQPRPTGSRSYWVILVEKGV